MLIMPSKDPDEILDYGVNWTDQMTADNDTIVTSMFIVDQGDVTIEASPAPSVDGHVTLAFISGGVLGEYAHITNRITTTGGRTWDETMKIRIRTR